MPLKPETERKYMTYGRLKSRPGWSEKVIAQFLPEPDTLRTNPHYRSAAPSKLYLLTRIAAVESQADWQQQAERTNRRKLSAISATQTKRNNLIGYVERLNIVVPALKANDLVELACAHYNARKASRMYEYDEDNSYWREATAESDTDFLKRICTNYLRHQLTRYETELERIAGKVGVQEAYELLKKRVNEAIVNQYPQLAPCPDLKLKSCS